ncbi:hypothetical protein WBG06_10580 [Nocardioides sp. CCNWLW239]|uniref:hypothetical protein n=1 Tax=Nocardioides sp. CCNWLW239 TaxID=3128902 RepID=UPI00301AD833
MSLRGFFRVDASTLGMIGDEALAEMREGGASASLVKRKEVGSDTSPAIVQLIEIDATINESRFDLYQAQVIQAIVDNETPWKRIVLIFAVTCTYAQWAVVGSEFRDFVADAKIVPGAVELLETALG